MSAATRPVRPARGRGGRVALLASFAALGCLVAACETVRYATREPVPPPAAAPGPVELVPPSHHTNTVTALAVSPRSPYLVTASKDRALIVWDLETGAFVRRLRGHDGAVTAAVFHPDGRMVASGSADDTIRLWHVADGREVRRYRLDPGFFKFLPARETVGGIRALAFAPDGRTLYVGTGVGVYALDLETGRQRKLGRGGILLLEVAIPSLAVSADGRYLAAATWAGAYVWPLESEGAPRLLDQLGGEVSSVAFSPDGGRLALGGEDGQVLVQAVETGAVLKRLPGHTKRINGLAYSSDGRLLVTAGADETARVWDLSGESASPLHQKDMARASAVAFVPGRPTVLVGGFGFAVAWSPVTQQTTAVYASRLLHQVPFSLALSDDDAYVLSALAGDAVAWDLRSGREVRRFGHPEGDPIATVVWGAGGRVATRTVDGAVQIWDVRTGARLLELPKHRGSSRAMVFSPDGERLLIGAEDGVRIWHLGARRLERHVAPWASILKGGVMAAAFSPDGRRVAYATWDPAFRPVILDLETGDTVNPGDVAGAQGRALREAFGGDNPSPVAMQFSPDGRYLVTGAADGWVRMHDARTGDELHAARHPDRVTTVDASPDGGLYLAGSGSTIYVHAWKPPAGGPGPPEASAPYPLAGHSGEVVGARFIRGGRQILSAGQDGTWRIWDAETGALLVSYVSDRGGNWLAFTPDGLFDGTPEAWRDMRWRFREEADRLVPVEIFFNEFFAPGLLEAAAAGSMPVAPRRLAQLDRRQPTVRIVQADRMATSDGRPLARIRLHVEQAPPDARHEHGSGARDLRLFRNGRLVHAWKGALLAPGQTSVQLETQVPLLAGENRFTAYAFNDDQIKSADAVPVTLPGGSRGRAKAYVLAVGINGYAGGWRPLAFSAADAETVVSNVTAALGRLGEVDPVPVPLLEAAATRDHILNTLRRLAGEKDVRLPPHLQGLGAVQPEDVVVIFLSGHGTASQGRYFFVPHDLEADGSDGSMQGAISDGDLEAAIERIPAKELVLVIDSCHAGQVLGGGELRVGPMNSKGLAQLAWEKGVLVLAASQSYQEALEAVKHGHGLLTNALINEGLVQGLADHDPADGRLVAREWLDYAVARVPELHAEVIRARRTVAAERRRLLGGAAADAGLGVATDSPRPPRQQPRVFYRRQPSPDPFVISVWSGLAVGR